VYAKALVLADKAGMKAADECSVTMLTIRGYDPFPVCGFAWVHFKPATTPFVCWLKQRGHARKAHAVGGALMGVSKFGQSYDKKLAYARAYADVIQQEMVLSGVEPTLNVYAAGKLD
jgi:hypothetical protein